MLQSHVFLYLETRAPQLVNLTEPHITKTTPSKRANTFIWIPNDTYTYAYTDTYAYTNPSLLSSS